MIHQIFLCLPFLHLLLGVCKSIQKYSKVSKSIQMHSNAFKNIQKYPSISKGFNEAKKVYSLHSIFQSSPLVLPTDFGHLQCFFFPKNDAKYSFGWGALWLAQLNPVGAFLSYDPLEESNGVVVFNQGSSSSCFGVVFFCCGKGLELWSWRKCIPSA